jgi:OOP family OmpA-OmpF porin
MKKLQTLVAVLLVSVPAACSAPRQVPDAAGVSFPLREASYRREGIVVAADTLRLLRPGLSKDQVRQLLGDPHFSEGLFLVRDWNYILELPLADGGRLGCQLQIRFDGHDKLATTHWQTGECAAAVAMPASPAVTAASAPAAESSEIESSLEEGLIFEFGRSDLDGLRDTDRARLEALAARLGRQAASVRHITVVGRADRIGSAERKDQLSLARARTVAAVFAGQGVAPERIETVGRSDAEPLSGCAPGLAYADLLACLAPDRRVSVTVQRSLAGG